MEYAASVGLVLDPWQALVLEGALGEAGPLWAALEVALIVGRQCGKGAVLEARELAGVELFGEKLIIHTAHLLSTSEEARLRMEQIIEASPDLDRSCKRVIRSNGKEAIEFKNGARIKYMARSKGSGRGLTADCVIFDEAMYLDADVIESMMPAMAAVPNPQLWYTGSAGFADSTQLISVRERALAGGDPGLAYFEWSAPKDSDLDDPQAWALANPALGIRLTERFMRSERLALEEAGFARERLGIWDEQQAERLIDAAQWQALADPSSVPTDPVAFGVEVASDRRTSSIAVCGKRPDGKLHLEVVDHRPGTGWLVDRVKKLQTSWGPTAIGIDPGGPVGSLLPVFREAEVEVRELSTREIGQACGGFYDDVVEDRLRHLDQSEFRSATAVARKKPSGEAWRWSRREVEVTPLYAATVARFAFIDTEPTGDILF